jgi:multiple sugar transport system ATP-binding protein
MTGGGTVRRWLPVLRPVARAAAAVGRANPAAQQGLGRMAEVNLRQVVKRFDGVEAVRGIDLDIADEEFVVLVGPSGCGKSTTLRMIAGLEDITDGDILIDGSVVNDVAPKDRDIAMVFQNYALYPHMSVFQNMSFGLRVKRVAKAEIKTRVNEAARILGITELLDRKPKQLSGGQRQRVAMGRAIVRNPKVFLFDEPLSNLDAQLRVQMRTEIKKLRHKVRSTTVYVTHDQVEALTLADRVVVMNQGRIEQVGTPHELYNAPRTRFVAGFIGSPAMNFLPARVEQADGGLAVRLSRDLVLAVPDSRRQRYASLVGRDNLLLGLRPEHINEAQGNASPGRVAFDAQIDVTEPVGTETFVYFMVDDKEVCGRVNQSAGAREGETMRLSADLDNMQIIDGDSGLVV